jgi:trk system potassium uptake protein TrkH
MKQTTIKGYPMILGYLGFFMILIGFIILLPLVILIFDPTELDQAHFWIIPGVSSMIIGYLLSQILKGKTTSKLERHQDAVLLSLIWIFAILISSFPLLLSGNYTFTQSIFESTSGFSTTGLSVVDVTQASKMLLLYRSLMQFFGGIGLVLVLTSAISDKYGMRLYHAEGHNDKLLPNLARSARLIISIYSVYILIGTAVYVFFGMGFFDAINHAIASLSTGGFSTRATSIGYYQSVGIEVTTIVLMLLGSTNLIIHLFFFKGKFKKAFQHIEMQLFIVLTFVFLVLLWLSILYTDNMGFRQVLFQYVSAITTTGFQTVPSFQGLPHLFNFGVIILMIIGGQAGSTSGGIKQYRIGLLLKEMYWNIRDRISHQRTIHTYDMYKFGKRIDVTQDDFHTNHTFINIYLLTLTLGTMIFMAYGYTLEESLFEFSSALGTVGLSIGITNMNMSPVLLWTSTIGMLLGRLEFYVLIIAFSKMILNLTKKKVL